MEQPFSLKEQTEDARGEDEDGQRDEHESLRCACMSPDTQGNDDAYNDK